MASPPPTQALRIFVINLERAGERWEKTRSGLAALGLCAERFAAIDAKLGQHQAVSRYDEAASLRFQGAPQTAATMGCFASHYLLWQEIAAAGEAALVLEDDLAFDPGFRQALALGQGLIESHRYIRLAALSQGRKPIVLKALDEEYSLAFYRRRPMGSQAYLLSPDGAARLLRHAERWREPVDDFLDAYWRHGLTAYAILPYRAQHRDAGFSYIQSGTEAYRRSPSEHLRFKLHRRIDAVRARLWLLRNRPG